MTYVTLQDAPALGVTQLETPVEQELLDLAAHLRTQSERVVAITDCGVVVTTYDSHFDEVEATPVFLDAPPARPWAYGQPVFSAWHNRWLHYV